jgi:hypothetical protein
MVIDTMNLEVGMYVNVVIFNEATHCYLIPTIETLIQAFEINKAGLFARTCHGLISLDRCCRTFQEASKKCEELNSTQR